MTENVYLFVPNLIGYVRILLAFLSFYYMPTDHVTATWCYIISGLLDAVDGHAARMLNQSSKFGAMLDMLTDRCATLCLLVVLAQFYPRATFLFQLSMVIDIASHWLHLHTNLTFLLFLISEGIMKRKYSIFEHIFYAVGQLITVLFCYSHTSSQMKGSSSHKQIDLSGNPVLRHYYQNKNILFTMCAGNELFYCMLYLCHFTSGPEFPLISVGLWTVVCCLCAPIALAKTAISLVHLYAASHNITNIDVAERAEAASNKRD